MKKILIMTNHADDIYCFRKELIEKLYSDGNEIIISCPYGEKLDLLDSIKFELDNPAIDRRGINPIRDFKLLIHYIKLIKRIKPDVVLAYTIKPNVYGSIACRFCKVEYINNITGLGSVLNKGKLLQVLIYRLLKFALKKSKCVFFQNETNMNLILEKKIISGNYQLIPGSGVNTERFPLQTYPEDDNKIVFNYIGRVLSEKGVDDYIEAARIIKGKYPQTEFNIIGFIEPTESHYNEDFKKLEKENIIIYRGEQKDVRTFIQRSHAIIHPSKYGEGMSNVLLENASSGRPIITTDNPGCFETVNDGVTGYVYEKGNVKDLIDKIEKFIKLDNSKREKMGLNGRKKMKKEFDRNIVVKSYIEKIDKKQMNNKSKNVFMLVNYTPEDLSIGITKKISAEINAFRNLGFEVFYSAYVKEGIAIFDNNDKIIYKKNFFIKNEKYKKYKRYFLLLDCVDEYFKKSSKSFDVCYGRLLAPTKKYLNILKSFKNKNAKVLIESLAYFPGIKFKSIKGKYILKMIDKNKNKFPDCIDFFLTEGKFDNFYGIPSLETKIGVETKLIKKHEYKGNRNELNMISVANETLYHGYDRVIRSLYEYNNRSKKFVIKIHLVGVVSKETKNLIKNLKLEDSVILYGKRYGKELDRIYDLCNVAIGPLGQHRIGGKKDTGLKTKEYFAKGIPYFYSGKELTELLNCKYIYEIKSNDNTFRLEDIIDFYNSYKNDNQVEMNMRKISVELFSWEKILSEVIKKAYNIGDINE